MFTVIYSVLNDALWNIYNTLSKLGFISSFISYIYRYVIIRCQDNTPLCWFYILCCCIPNDLKCIRSFSRRILVVSPQLHVRPSHSSRVVSPIEIPHNSYHTFCKFFSLFPLSITFFPSVLFLPLTFNSEIMSTFSNFAVLKTF